MANSGNLRLKVLCILYAIVGIASFLVQPMNYPAWVTCFVLAVSAATLCYAVISKPRKTALIIASGSILAFPVLAFIVMILLDKIR